ncbi:MAG TPA: hypothetical protein DCZ95_09370 [Verrucomicrobia bacterium]|nr:MAG: hypothetical protein A2X46_06365 [Lentisphaerae bacterium GWF2_57_35]HBA84288.1 hypothetical protein [Verrucomicrobiota bacterium]
MGSHAAQETDRASLLRWRVLMAFVFLLGLGLRVFKAWTMQCSANPDFGVAALMSKHMAEGLDFPIFFYGQAYMGSLEPAMGALFCRLFGTSGFAVNLGTALTGFFILPLVYLWARDAGGRRAGLAAVLFCLVGSDTTFHYGVAPRGGYMTLMVCGLLTLWLSLRIAVRLSRNESVSVWPYVWLGLAAGLGWWSHQLAVVFFIAAAGVLLLGFRKKMLTHGLLPASLAFLAGSLPWWLWNAAHGWASFGFAGSLGQVSLQAGFQSLAHQFLNLVELSLSRPVANGFRLMLLVMLIGYFLVKFVREKWRGIESDRFLPRAGAVAVVLAMTAVYVTSKYANIPVSRYLLPLYPAVAVMIAVSVGDLLGRFRFPWGWLALAAVIPSHILLLPKMTESIDEGTLYWTSAQKLAGALGPLCDGICFGPFTRYWINFATDEKLCVACPPKEHYEPYARRAELAENPAFLDDFHGVRKFLAMTCAQGQSEIMHHALVTYGTTPPPDNWRYVEPSALSDVQDEEGRDFRPAISDYCLDTAWAARGTNPVQLTATFDRPRALNGLRFLSPNDRYPGRVTIEGQADGDEAWRRLLDVPQVTDFFWSGPRIMVAGIQYFQEFRFTAPTGGLRRLRLTVEALPRWGETSLGEILFLEAAPETEDALPSVEQCAEALKQKQIRVLHAPRWLAGRIAQVRPDLKIEPLPSALTRTLQDEMRRDSSVPYPMAVNAVTGLILDERDAPRTRERLAASGLDWTETSLGRYRLLAVDGSESESGRSLGLCWTELGCFNVNTTLPR